MEEIQSAKMASVRMDAATSASLATCIATINDLEVPKKNIVQVLQDAKTGMWIILFYH